MESEVEGEHPYVDIEEDNEDTQLYTDVDIIDYDLNLESSSLDGDSLLGDDDGYPETPEQMISRQEQLRMIHLRTYLNQLAEKVRQRQQNVDQTREELKKCHDKMTQLEAERDQVYDEVQMAEDTNHISALYRLRARHEKLCKELDVEQDLEVQIKDSLDKAQYELAKADVEKGKFLLAEDELLQKEKLLQEGKTGMAVIRSKKEEKYARQAIKSKQDKDRKQIELLELKEAQQQHAFEQAKKSQERTNVFLKETVTKIRQREVEEDARSKEELQKKMDMLLKLKHDISANRENLHALRARDKASEKKEKALEETERQKILQAGGNPDEIIMIKKRLNEMERNKKEFETTEREKKAQIIHKVLIEEERMKKRKKQQPHLWTDAKQEQKKIVAPHIKKSLKILQGDEGNVTVAKPDPVTEYLKQSKEDDDYDDELPKISMQDVEMKSDSSESEKEDTDDIDGNTDFAKPEFDGLWDQHKPYHVPREQESPVKGIGRTKMDKEIMAKVMEKHREGIITKQVVGGREFKGCPFYSKPDIIHFKDFEVGKTYKKRVTLTNVSYTVNYCKLVGITERLKDFIDILFDPPGQMSAGLTCEMMVTFKPKINEDLVGEVNFLAQSGAFSIPLQCTTKKCDLHLDVGVVDFGTTVIGESLKQSITLTNKGALGTRFEFFKVTGLKPRTVTTAETSIGRLTTADTSGAISPVVSEVVEKSKTDLAPVPEEKKDLEKTSEQPVVAAVSEEAAGKTPPAGDDSDAALTAESDTLIEAQKSELLEPVREAASSVSSTPDLGLSDIDDYSTLDDLTVGPLSTGEIKPFSSVKLQVQWQPTVPGQVESEFVVSFTDQMSDTLAVRALGNAIDVPVWVERQAIDMKICMFDRLYQDTILVNNRASTALRLKFEVCKELRNHLELLPKTGYIQAKSQFSAQLKFLPRKSLFEEGGQFFDPETGVIEAPMLIRVANQTQPVPFTVHAVVTNSDLEFDVTNIDFGHCTIYESVKTSIQLTNKSILPQQYGFVGHPDYVDVQPNDGFGTLLPLETINLDVIFSPKKAHNYKFVLLCKSLINRDFRIQCCGVGVHPPLDLSHQVVHFAATALYDVSTASLHVCNDHISTNEFTHPVPRIGKGDIAPVGPTSFEFVVPEDAPLTISPSVGTIEPGKKCHIQIRFSPTLNEEDVRKEAVRMATKQGEAEAEREYRESLKKEQDMQEQALKKKSSGKAKQPSPTAKKRRPSITPTEHVISGPKPTVPPDPNNIDKGSSAYSAAIGSLLRQYRSSFKSFTVPCYVATGQCGNPGELEYSIHNTLYLEVHCPAVKPQIVVISDNGRTNIDFGEVSIGRNSSKSITIQNIFDKHVELKSSLLDTTGPFMMLNALRMLPPDSTHTILLTFTPTAGRVFHEVLEIQTPTSTLYLTLTGRGVSPIVNLSFDGGVFDMNDVIVGEYVEKTFKIHNTSSLSIDYAIKMDSLSILRHTKAQKIPNYIRRNTREKSYIGPQNNNGQNVFDCVPPAGTISAGGNREITVTFAPDHGSDHFSDGVRLELFNQEESHFFQVKGKAKPHIMFIDGGDDLAPDIESLAAAISITDEDDESKPIVVPILCTLTSSTKDGELIMATRDLFVGCVRTMAVSQKKESKKNGEFIFENIQQISAKGFNVDPQRGLIEAGTRKPITITWTPPQGHDPNQTMEASVLVTLKGDVVETYKILLRAMILSE